MYKSAKVEMREREREREESPSPIGSCTRDIFSFNYLIHSLCIVWRAIIRLGPQQLGPSYCFTSFDCHIIEHAHTPILLFKFFE